MVVCAGRWSNLVRPAAAAPQLTTNSIAYTAVPGSDSQVQPSRRRQLLGKGSNQAVVAASWLNEHSRVQGGYRAGSTGADGTLIFSDSGTTSNGSLVDGLTNTLIMTGTSRWPAVYTVGQLHLSIIVLFAVLVVASVLQVAVIGLWKLFRFKAEDLPK
jgi:hypothetical protein